MVVGREEARLCGRFMTRPTLLKEHVFPTLPKEQVSTTSLVHCRCWQNCPLCFPSRPMSCQTSHLLRRLNEPQAMKCW